ncbi:hypothetical protein BOTBODRAFT_49557 [Botryobasidium botryosum FD-172 SS1]|uniref:Uncharacterized protein n=1 Tax=Botryobasidium botryosum (strain FD-172 SS1) TaxID=930990 RepID=A0A067LV37_BOTB1|nr:hypothetical protein BOTBODRAFT_49557 [Botryobasidium botryosum FD-172 SS1]
MLQAVEWFEDAEKLRLSELQQTNTRARDNAVPRRDFTNQNQRRDSQQRHAMPAGQNQPRNNGNRHNDRRRADADLALMFAKFDDGTYMFEDILFGTDSEDESEASSDKEHSGDSSGDDSDGSSDLDDEPDLPGLTAVSDSEDESWIDNQRYAEDPAQTPGVEDWNSDDTDWDEDPHYTDDDSCSETDPDMPDLLEVSDSDSELEEEPVILEDLPRLPARKDDNDSDDNGTLESCAVAGAPTKLKTPGKAQKGQRAKRPKASTTDTDTLDGLERNTVKPKDFT